MQELEEILARSRATASFKAQVRDYHLDLDAPSIRVSGRVPTIKVRRLLKQLLSREKDLTVEAISLTASSGCSDFAGTLHVDAAQHEPRVIEFEWCCRWKAAELGWVDHFGLPDQIRAARELDWRCFRSWEQVT
jgi:hypothetical protein